MASSRHSWTYPLKIIPVFLVATLLCFSSVLASQHKIPVSVSISPLKYMLKQVGGEQVEVSVMVSSGANPATYEPNSSQMAGLSDTELYFAIGVPFESSWLQRFSKVNKEMRIVRLDQEVKKRTLATGYDQDAELDQKEAEINKDPHVWLSPVLMRIMSLKVMQILSGMDPGHESLYRQNYLEFSREINRLDKKILDMFSGAKKRQYRFMCLHPAWGYLARDYGLKQIPIELEGKTPGPKEMKKVIKIANDKDIDTIFVQPQFSRKKAETIAKSINAQVVGLDPLAYDWSDNLLEMAKKIAKALR